MSRATLDSIETVAGLESRFLRERRRDSRLVMRLIGRISTTAFLVTELVLIGGWYLFNSLAGHAAFDAEPFSLLGVLLATQGVVITTLLLIRTADISRRGREREHLSLHIAILTERKLTRMLKLSMILLERGGVPREEIERELGELLRFDTVDEVMGEIRSHMPPD